MLDQLESNYNCANAGADLHQLKQELEKLISDGESEHSLEATELKNRIENQIHFIQTKCDIH